MIFDVQIRDAMIQRSARLNHKYQLPLDMNGAGTEIVDIIKSS